jgi:hypothetical protein
MLKAAGLAAFSFHRLPEERCLQIHSTDVDVLWLLARMGEAISLLIPGVDTEDDVETLTPEDPWRFETRFLMPNLTRHRSHRTPGTLTTRTPRPPSCSLRPKQNSAARDATSPPDRAIVMTPERLPISHGVATA